MPTWSKKYRYATRENISNRKMGRKVMMLYLDVTTRLLTKSPRPWLRRWCSWASTQIVRVLSSAVPSDCQCVWGEGGGGGGPGGRGGGVSYGSQREEQWTHVVLRTQATRYQTSTGSPSLC